MDNIFGVIVNVKHIYIPDKVKMNEDEYKALKGFVDLESISVTRRQFKLQRDAKYKFEIRVPQEADMIATSKTKSLIDFIVSKNTSNEQKITGTDLFMMFEVASRAGSEDTALAAMALFAITKKVCTIDDLIGQIDNNIIASIRELLSPDIKTDWDKARVIKKYYWFEEAYDLNTEILKKYGIRTQDNIEFHLRCHGNKLFDIGQTFKANIKIEDGVAYGFNGQGGLGYFKYYMKGMVSHRLALDIIRRTSTYQIYGKEIVETLGYKHIDLDFFKQHWFFSDHESLPVWCYPNGVIQASGYRTALSIGEILLESYYLAAIFKGINMEVELIQEAIEDLRAEKSRIYISIKHGRVIASTKSKDLVGYTYELHREYIDKIDKLRENGEIGLSLDELEEISRRNKRDAKYCKQNPDELWELTEGLDLDLCFRLELYLKENHGITLSTCGRQLNPNYYMLKYLFDFDMNKLKQYLKQYEQERKEMFI